MKITTTYKKDVTGAIIVTTRYEGTEEELHHMELQCLRNIGTGKLISTEVINDSSTSNQKVDEEKEAK